MLPYASWPICEMTVGVPSVNGATCMWLSMIDRPRNITPSSDPMMTSVLRAFFHAGWRNAGTPFEIASTPVTAAPPDANAWSTSASDAPMSRPLPWWPNGMTPETPW